jgi:DNA polymerase-3 subunit epsilon
MIEAVAEVSKISSAKIWTCSFKQVDWAQMGFLSAKQELLSLFHGFHYSGHRALTDIDALANLIGKMKAEFTTIELRDRFKT